jgi:DNA-binding NtrC family response regulator
MAESTLTVLSFASKASRERLGHVLADIGYRIRLVNRGDDPCRSAPDLRQALSLLLFDTNRCIATDLEAAVHSADRSPCIGLIEGADPLVARDLVQRCLDFTTWPCSAQELSLRLRRFDAAELRPEPPLDAAALHRFAHLNLLGRSPRFVRVLTLIDRFAAAEAPVLIQGETGTGKELVARAIHYLGSRQARPFIPVNCGAIPDSLMESELFGHERGAFTDARHAHAGLVAQANGGTLFLDEIESLSPRGQVALLRFLQDQVYRPLGGTRCHRSDVRLIAAGNADLKARADLGRFRSDLYFRLHVLVLTLPPLRSRAEDIGLIARHLCDRLCRHYGQARRRFHPAVMSWMRRHEWPGNVRELENFVHRSFLLSDGELIDVVDGDADDEPASAAPDDPGPDGDFRRAKARAIADFERRYLRRLMTDTAGNVSQAARRAGKDRRTFRRLLDKHDLRRAQARSGVP